jgi:hypothetical protein
MKSPAINFNPWLRLRNWYWVKTKPKLFLMEKAMTATENGLTREMANQLAKAAMKKSPGGPVVATPAPNGNHRSRPKNFR